MDALGGGMRASKLIQQLVLHACNLKPCTAVLLGLSLELAEQLQGDGQAWRDERHTCRLAKERPELRAGSTIQANLAVVQMLGWARARLRPDSDHRR